MGGLLIVLTVLSIRQIETTQVLIKSSKFSKHYKVCTGRALVFPILHSARFIDLQTKTIALERVEHESLSCKDGIRIEVNLEFIIGVNKTEKDILLVSERIGCKNTFNLAFVEKNFKNTFLDALKSIALTLNYEDINGSYQDDDNQEDQDALTQKDCWANFKQLVLHKFGNHIDGRIEENGKIILEGYYIRDMRIIEIEMLHNLDAYNLKAINDARGIRKITQISAEQNEITKQRELKSQTILDKIRANKEKSHEETEQEISKDKATSSKLKIELESETIQKTMAFEKQQQILKIENDHAVFETGEEKKQVSLIKDEERKKELSSKEREREREEAEDKKGLLEILTTTSKQEEEKNKAEIKAKSAKEIEKAEGEKILENIKAQTKAQTQYASTEARAKAEAEEIKVTAEAKLEAAEKNFMAADKDSQALLKMGQVEADVMRAKVEAENAINQPRINAQIIQELIPVLPKLVESLMLPAEKIDSIKFLNINGMEGLTRPNNDIDNVSQIANPPFNSLLNTIMNVGMALPVMMGIMKMLKDDNSHQTLYHDIVNLVKNIPGGEKLIEQLEDNQAE